MAVTPRRRQHLCERGNYSTGPAFLLPPRWMPLTGGETNPLPACRCIVVTGGLGWLSGAKRQKQRPEGTVVPRSHRKTFQAKTHLHIICSLCSVYLCSTNSQQKALSKSKI
ncbi:hypothetical protein CHARACLAT_026415 [Characodon lateralis]|uniref:Uncharacterized protein n=1 Tax=Characodon lateralis TaxID=208331 RepID=A0ABU7F7B4_9TELE|nr:hypothetical protein [Characodon lateralis]